METLLGTAKKLGVNFFQYIRDRVSGARPMKVIHPIAILVLLAALEEGRLAGVLLHRRVQGFAAIQNIVSSQ
jgi:hypothetical protein